MRPYYFVYMKKHFKFTCMSQPDEVRSHLELGAISVKWNENFNVNLGECSAWRVLIG